jgi:hypothetical protein
MTKPGFVEKRMKQMEAIKKITSTIKKTKVKKLASKL